MGAYHNSRAERSEGKPRHFVRVPRNVITEGETTAKKRTADQGRHEIPWTLDKEFKGPFHIELITAEYCGAERAGIGDTQHV